MAIDIKFLRDTKHGGDAAQPEAVADLLAQFINAAQSSIHIAIYDFRLKDQKLQDKIVNSLTSKAADGVEVLIGFYAGKPPAHARRGVSSSELSMDLNDLLEVGGDPAPKGTQEQLEKLFPQDSQVKLTAIQGAKLMHDKYIVRDANTEDAALWTGSTNFTDDAWTYQENNIVQITSAPTLCAFFENDFQELWRTGNIKSTGVGDTGTTYIEGTAIDYGFSPGEGKTIDNIIANLITTARSRIKVASMVLTSHVILAALDQAIHHNQVDTFTGIYDQTQMKEIVNKWKQSANSAGVAQLFENVSQELVGKKSFPYTAEGKHNFMHNKVVVCDNAVVTGSFNFSRSATENAENMLVLHSSKLADDYSNYIDQLVAEYRQR